MFKNDGDDDNFFPDRENDTFYDSHEDITDDEDDVAENTKKDESNDAPPDDNPTDDDRKPPGAITGATRVPETKAEANTYPTETEQPILSHVATSEKSIDNYVWNTHVANPTAGIPTPPWIHAENPQALDPSNIPLDYDGKPLLKHDKVKIMTKGRWRKAKGSIGKIVNFGEGSGEHTWVTLKVDHIDSLQHRLAKNLKFVSRDTVSSVSTKLSDFCIGKHQN